MKYELTYVCINCDTRWSEIVTKEKLNEVFNGKYEIMTKDWLYLLFKHGMEMHHCKIFLNHELVEGVISYGKCIAIRPIREE